MKIIKLFPISRFWWKNRERSTDCEVKLTQRYVDTQAVIIEKSYEQIESLTYNKNGRANKDKK